MGFKVNLRYEAMLTGRDGLIEKVERFIQNRRGFKLRIAAFSEIKQDIETIDATGKLLFYIIERVNYGNERRTTWGREYSGCNKR